MKALPSSAAILDEVTDIVYGDRQASYGHPADNFSDICCAWSAYLHARKLLPRQIFLAPRDVAQMMVLQKVMRDGNAPKHDNLVDQIGYTLTAHRIIAES